MTPSSPTASIRTRGFTLIELMVTVAIAAILASIAVASYHLQVQKSRRTDARTALLDLAGREERYFSLNNAYSSTPSDLGYAGFGAGTSVGSGYYQLDVPVAPAPVGTAPWAFTLEAEPIGTQLNDTSCRFFYVDNTGRQWSTDAGGSDTTSTCW